MNHSYFRFLSVDSKMQLVITLLALFFLSLLSGNDVPGKEVEGGNKAPTDQIQDTYGKLPLYFIRNDGQIDERVIFYEKGSGHGTFFSKEGVSILLNNDLVKLTFLNANTNPEIIAADQQEGKVNYFIGNAPGKWKTNVPTFKYVLYKDVYPSIDIKFYGNNRHLEYDIIVKPGADPSEAAFAYEGIEGMKVTEEGDLEVALKQGKIVQKKPYIFQEIDGKKNELAGRFVINSTHATGKEKVRDKEDMRPFSYGFEVASYDKTQSLVIDPWLVYSTYVGGSEDDWGFNIAVDATGNVFVKGTVDANWAMDFPSTPGAYDTTHNGNEDIFIMKLNPAGSALIYATFLGSTHVDWGYGFAIDASGSAYVTGTTGSTDFPTTVNAYDRTLSGSQDVFVSKLDPTGSVLLYSTYLGGFNGEIGYALTVDASGNAYVTGYAAADFPVTSGAYDTSNNGLSDTFVVKLNATGSDLIYGTFIGGDNEDVGYGITLDVSGNVYVTGSTMSADFPTTVSAYDNSYNGMRDSFVVKLNADGSALGYSTFLGGGGDDWGSGMKLDASGGAYIVGVTGSVDFPVTTGAYDETYNGGSSDIFVAGIDSTGSSLNYGTFLGGTGDDWAAYSVELDTNGNLFLSGGTTSIDFPTTSGAYDTSLSGNADAIIARFNSTGSALTYGTFLGGSADETGYGMALDNSGNAYITGITLSSDFPVTSGAYDGSYNGMTDVFVLKFSFSPDTRVNQSGFGDQRYPWADYNQDADEYLVLWQDKRNVVDDDIYGVRLDRDGNRIGSDFAVSTAGGHQQRVLVKAGAGGYLTLWHDLRNEGANGADIYGAWISGTGTVGPEMAICECARDQWNPVAGYDPVSNTFLVVFLDGRGIWNNVTGNINDDFDLYGVIIPAGGSQNLTPFPLIEASNGQRGPQIGYDYGNNQYYLAWNDRRSRVNYDIFGSRVTTTGTLLDGTGVLLSGASGNQFRPTVTDLRPVAGVNNHLIVWTDFRSGSQADVYGIYVDGNGAAVGSEFAISTNSADQQNVVADVDWINTKKNLIGFIDKRSGVDYDIYSATVDQTGVVTGDMVIAGQATGATGEQRAEVVTYATDGVNDYGFLTVWMDQRNGTDYDIYGIKVWP